MTGATGVTGATGATGPAGPTGSAGTSLNLIKIATLHWYNVNQTGMAYTVGANPIAICFDGTNIWVANQGNDSVTELKASDGSLVGNYNAAGLGLSNPVGICFDGIHIWVTYYFSGTVSKY